MKSEPKGKPAKLIRVPRLKGRPAWPTHGKPIIQHNTQPGSTTPAPVPPTPFPWAKEGNT